MPQKQHERGAGCNTAFWFLIKISCFSPESNGKVFCICILIVKAKKAKLPNYLPRLFEMYRAEAEPAVERGWFFGCLYLPGCVTIALLHSIWKQRVSNQGVKSHFGTCLQEHTVMQKPKRSKVSTDLDPLKAHAPNTHSWVTGGSLVRPAASLVWGDPQVTGRSRGSSFLWERFHALLHFST